VQVADGTVSFHIENVVQGDILLRCRHLTASGQRVSMFRAAFHTGYVPPNVMRLTKAQLDGACADKRFSDDFFLDLIFEPCETEVASKHLSGKADATLGGNSDKDDEGEAQNEAEDRRGRGTITGEAQMSPPVKPESTQNPTVTASAYDSMLHRDSRFWDVIATRRQEHASGEGSSSEDPLYGPTIGRRRKFETAEKKDSTPSKQLGTQSSFQAFSIGGSDMDFGAVVKKPEPTVTATITSVEPKRDELMEALMAIDDDVTSPVSPKPRRQPAEMEEIVFESADDMEQTSKPPPVFKEETKEVAEETSKEKTEKSDETKTPAESSKEEEEEEEEDKSEKVAADPTDEMAALLNDANLDVDADAFLAAAAEGGATDETFDFDVDDDELEDLESFLSKSK